MPTNLISLAMQSLTPDLINRIASVFGLDRSVIDKFAAAAVPSLLGGFTKLAATPEGARKLYDTVSKQPPGMLDSLTNALGGSGQKTIEEKGLSMVSSLFGGSTTQTLTSAIARFAGIDSGSTSSLLGLIAPLVTGVLAKQTNAGNLDASGLAQMLSSQKNNIQAALPAGFGELLKGSNFFGDFAGMAGQTTRATSSAAQTASVSALQASRGTASSGSSMNWAYWAIPAAIAVAAGWWLVGNRTTAPVREQARTETQQTPSQTTQTTPETSPMQPSTETTAAIPADNPAARAAQALTVLKGVPGGTEIANQTSSAMDTLKASLDSIKDAATAQTALPKLQDAQTQLDKVNGLAAQLPTAGRSAFATIIGASMPTINKELDKILAIPGVASILQKPIDGLRNEFQTMAKAPA